MTQPDTSGKQLPACGAITTTAAGDAIPLLNKQISNLTVIGSVNFQVNSPLIGAESQMATR